jgi:molybdate transport system substrate-binding protein
MNARTRALVVLAGLAAMATALAGCSSSKSTTTITVSAASSLTDAFGAIGRGFETLHPDTTVRFNFDSSSTLARQIESGAAADVFASADTENMTALTDAHLIAGRPHAFARNELGIVVKPGNPSDVKSLADLPRLGTVSLCGSNVPCGRYAQQALDNAGVSIPESRITRGQNVKATLAAVTNGDADASIVYVTDAKTAGTAVHTVPIPAPENVVATYPIGVVRTTDHASVARQFVSYVTSSRGRATMLSYGFLSP